MLRAADVEFHPHSFADPDGRVFRWDGGLYRGLRGAQAEVFGSLLAAGVLAELSGRGILVGTEPTSLTLEGYDLVLRHEEIPFPSYPTEWCTAMFAAAARAYLDLLDQLQEQGLGLKDVHPWNLVFDATRPRFVDLTSIARAEDCSPSALEEKYRRYYLLPLQLMTSGHAVVARNLLLEFDGVRRSDADALLRTSGGKLRRVAERARRPPQDLAELAARLRGHLEPLLAEAERAPAEDQAVGELEEAAAAVLRRLRPASASLFDPAPALPGYCLGDGRSLVVLDSDEARSAASYAGAFAKQLPILSLVVDFRRPTPSIGYSGHFSIAAHKRLASPFVVALDLAQRFAAQPFLTFEHLSEGVSLFTHRWALVGFGPPQLADPARRPPPWYGAGELRRALARRFATVEEAARIGETVLFLCQK